jgi:hypothetical protein
VVLTGYNTDIDHAGTVYHVQTEDKGRSNPFVESLVYASGEILYSRRTPYHDLVERGVEPQAVAAIMERQHRSIVDAIGAGRLHQLMSRDEEVASEDDTTLVRPRHAAAPASEISLDQVIVDYLQAQRGRAHLVLQAAREHDFVYGARIRVAIVAVESQTNAPMAGVEISVLFKSTAEPNRVVLAQGVTGADGQFRDEVTVPAYNGGTSAVVVSARSQLGLSEIKHLVHR